MYITVEGVIGCGKTSLTDLLATKYRAHAVYEKFEKNPYLEKFYKDVKKYSFQTEMFFLIDRYNQMLEIKDEFLDSNKNVIADYNLAKSLIFAQKTLDDENYKKFLNIYNILIMDFIRPDLIIVIRSDFKTLKKHILKRGREYEKGIEDEYLIYLIDKYEEYIKILEKDYSSKILVIDGVNYDFVCNELDKEKVLKKIDEFLEGVNE